MKRARCLAAVALFAAAAFWTADAQDKIFRVTGGDPLVGTIERVDDAKVYVTLGAGSTSLERAQVARVEAPRPAALDEAAAAIDQGQTADAIKALEPIVQKYRGLPQDWIEEAAARLAEAEAAVGNFAKARAACADFHKFYPKSRFTESVRSSEAEALYAEKKTDEALKLFEEIVATHEKEMVPSDEEGRVLAHACLRVGQIYAAKQQFENALNRLLRVTVIYRQNPGATAEALLESAGVYEALKNPASARSQLEELLQDFPNSALASKARQKLKSLPVSETAEPGKT